MATPFQAAFILDSEAECLREYPQIFTYLLFRARIINSHSTHRAQGVVFFTSPANKLQPPEAVRAYFKPKEVTYNKLFRASVATPTKQTVTGCASNC